MAFAADAYDDCIADLDEQLGKLVDELDRRGVLERTWLIITSDHGESFGEHAGVFCHGTSLYETELHVPLLIIPPGGSATKQAVKEPVSLRDLAATIVDVVGLQAGSPFPGVSLARFWKQPRRWHRPAAIRLTGARRGGPARPAQSRLLGCSQATLAAGSRQGRRLVVHPPGGRRPRGVVPLERRRQGAANLAGDPSAETTLEQMRAALDRLTGPLLTEQFNP